MSGIFKPINPKYVDVSNALTTGLVFDGQFYEGAGTTATELANSVAGTLTNGPAWGDSSFGKYVNFHVAANAYVTYTPVAAQKSLTTFSVEYYVYRTAAGGNGNGYGGYIFKYNGATNRYFFIENDNGDAGQGIIFAQAFSVATGRWSIAYPTNNIWTHYVWTYDNSSTTNDPICYKDGAVVTVTERNAPSGTLSTDGNNLIVGSGDGANDQPLGGRLLYMRVWNRILTSTEVTLLYGNPWRLYGQNFKINSLRPRVSAPGSAR